MPVHPTAQAQSHRYRRNALPLDWAPDDFMSEDGDHIMCHTHGALFEIEDGFCIAGPCAGDNLTPVTVAVDPAGNVILSESLSDLS